MARNAATVDACKAIANCAGRAVVAFALASVAVQQADAVARDEEARLDNDGPRAPAKPWQTFDNLVAAEPDRGVTTPITVATDVKTGLAGLLLAVADLANAVGKLPAVDPLGALARAPWREASIVRTMQRVTEQTRPGVLSRHPLSRDLEFLGVFRQKFESLVMAKSLVDPGAEAVARLYLDFLKTVAWQAGVWAYEGEHFTLNSTAFLAILSGLAATVPAEAVPAAQDTLSFARNQIEIREAAVARTKAAKKPAAKPAAPAANEGGVPQPITTEKLAERLVEILADAEPAADAKPAADVKPAAAAPKPAAAAPKPAAAAAPKPTAAAAPKPTAAAAPKPAAAAAKPAPQAALKPDEIAVEMNYDALLVDLQAR
jgi:hypothetical protein